MKKDSIIFASGNKSKFKELRYLFQKYDRDLIHERYDFIEPKLFELELISKHKAETAYEKIRRPLIVDDTGIFFFDYENFPGIYSADFFRSVGFDGIKRILKGTSKKAYYKTVITYIDDKGQKQYSGILKGRLSLVPSVIFDIDFPYDSVFITENSEKIRIEQTIQERFDNSHRAQAVKKLINELFKRTST